MTPPRAAGSTVRQRLLSVGIFGPDLLCPEIVVWNAEDLAAIAREVPDEKAVRPALWGYVWPAGRALARFVLDQQERFLGRRVLDLGCGSGIVACACAIAGAHVTALDVDRRALLVAAATARRNGLRIRLLRADLCREEQQAGSFDVVVAGEVFYSAAEATAMEQFLRRAASKGSRVIAADGGRAFCPRTGRRLLAKVRTPSNPKIDNVRFRDVEIFELEVEVEGPTASGTGGGFLASGRNQ